MLSPHVRTTCLPTFYTRGYLFTQISKEALHGYALHTHARTHARTHTRCGNVAQAMLGETSERPGGVHYDLSQAHTDTS